MLLRLGWYPSCPFPCHSCGSQLWLRFARSTRVFNDGFIAKGNWKDVPHAEGSASSCRRVGTARLLRPRNRWENRCRGACALKKKAACLSAHDQRASPADQGRKLQFLTISRVSAM